jgi:hypothetical protein
MLTSFPWVVTNAHTKTDPSGDAVMVKVLRLFWVGAGPHRQFRDRALARIVWRPAQMSGQTIATACKTPAPDEAAKETWPVRRLSALLDSTS